MYGRERIEVKIEQKDLVTALQLIRDDDDNQDLGNINGDKLIAMEFVKLFEPELGKKALITDFEQLYNGSLLLELSNALVSQQPNKKASSRQQSKGSQRSTGSRGLSSRKNDNQSSSSKPLGD